MAQKITATGRSCGDCGKKLSAPEAKNVFLTAEQYDTVEAGGAVPIKDVKLLCPKCIATTIEPDRLQAEAAKLQAEAIANTPEDYDQPGVF